MRGLIAYEGGDARVWRTVTLPTTEEEDRKRQHRERRVLIKEKGRHVNRIKGMLAQQGIYDFEPALANRWKILEQLRTGDQRTLPTCLRCAIERELHRLEFVLSQIKEIESEQRQWIEQEPDRQAQTVAHLTELRGIGWRSAAVVVNEALYRGFPNRRQLAAFAARQAELLPVPYFHVVFTLPAPIAAIAFQNKAAVYAILFAAAAEAMTTLASNPRRLGAQIGAVAVLHTWGQTLTHHPHVHCVVPGGGLSREGTRWIAGRPDFFLAVKPLAKLYRRLFLERLQKAYDAGALRFLGDLANLTDPQNFRALVADMRGANWVVYAKKPFGGPTQVLAYLGRYTHRVAIANSRLVALDNDHVAFTWKDYRQNGAAKIMKLVPDEFIRRFLLHALPDGFHRIRHFGFMANGHRAAKLGLCRSLLADQPERSEPPVNGHAAPKAKVSPRACPECGGNMRVVVTLRGDFVPSRPHASPLRCDTS
ncbi:IS91 family transposase [Methylocystis suflitae]|uniref:IS91 family transposase n=1 Tax=Methylocystis suflitae TaxID=2951405 RepID=UPI003898EC9E